MTCQWCGAPSRDVGSAKCSRCGAVYAKAAALAAGLPAPSSKTRPVDEAVPVTAAAVSLPPREDSVEHAVELQARIWFVPACFGLALFFQGMCGGRLLQRLFFTMPLHELGHAMTAWFCGFSAMPMFWQTRIADHRGIALPLLMAAGIASVLVRGVRERAWGWLAFGSCLALAQFVGTLLLSEANARALITFGGDAGALVLATACVGTFFFGEDTAFKHGQLRYGFVAIGSIAYVDVFSGWWAARRDWGVIPFGENEGVGLTDPTKLTDVYGWTIDAMVDRYVALGVACAWVCLAIWIWGIVSHARVWETIGVPRRRFGSAR
jgi:hypothetical protein